MKFFVFVVLFPASHFAIAQYNPNVQNKPRPLDVLPLSAAAPARTISPVIQALKVPVLLIALGVSVTQEHGVQNAVREERNEHLGNFKTSIDNYLLYVPIAAVYGLNMAGVKGKHDFRNRTLLLAKSEIIMYVLTNSLKSITNERRPDGSDYQSFPSGHTAQAFAAATFMAKEYGEQSPWYAVGAYGVATAVGAMRILNNRHWTSDVLAGAGIGILSTNIAYLTHRYRWKNMPANLSAIPTYGSGPGVYMSYRFP